MTTTRKQQAALAPEPLHNASPSRPACQACGLFRHCQTPFMRPFVPKGWTGQLVCVAEAPGEHEDEHSGRPLTGPSGRLLRRLLRAAGYGDRDVAFVNSCRCRPRGNATPTMAQVRACRPFLLRVLEVLKPQVVIALGATALRALTNDGRAVNVTAARGRPLPVPGATWEVRAFASYHPAAVLRGAGHLERLIVEDLRRAGWPELEWPKEGHLVPGVSLDEQVTPSAWLAVDTEFALDGRLLEIAVANRTRATTVTDAGERRLRYLFGRVDYLVGHNVAVDVDQLLRLGLAKPEWVDGSRLRDTLILARLEDENLGKGAYSLERQLLARHNVRPWKQDTEALGPDASQWPPDKRAERCRLDAWAAAVLAGDLADVAPRPLVEFTHRIAMTIHRLNLTGAVVDLHRLAEVEWALRFDMERAQSLLQHAAFKAGMREFVPTNDGHLRELLFRRLGLPVIERTAKNRKPKVDKAVLRQLAELNPIPKLILDFNRAQKLYSTYVEGTYRALRPFDDGRGWLEVRINPLGARTGRRSSGGRDEDGVGAGSSAPNMQNWPGCKTTCPPDCRLHPKQIVCSRFQGGLIGNFDYKSLEPLVLAWLAKDDRLFEAFTRGGGYLAFARDLFGKDIQKDTDEYRALKGVILGVHYGAGAWKIAEQLWTALGIRFSKRWERHLERTAELRKRYLDAVPGVRRYMRERKQELLTTGQVVGVLGRVRHLPHSFKRVPERGTPEWKQWKHLANEAVNFPVQWCAATVTGSALIDVERELLSAYGVSLVEHHRELLETGGRVNRTVIINEVHDALVLDLFPEHATRDIELVADTMRALPTLRWMIPDFSVPLDVDARVGPTWSG